MTMDAVFGPDDNTILLWQECLRAVLIFGFGLFLIRITGRRTFAQWSPLDFVVSVIVGSSLARALTGGVPLWGTLAAVAVLGLLHWTIAWLAAHNDWLSHWVEGSAVVLVDNGVLNERNRLRHNISHADLAEALRREGLSDLGAAKRVTLEPNGFITVLKKA